MFKLKRSDVFITVLIFAIGLWYLATLRPGHDWGGDFALYIRHAMNIVEGRPYGESGYLYNPHLPMLSPRTYPPGYPLLLAPVYKFFGLDVTAMRVEIIALFMGCLGLLYILFRRRLSLRSMTALIGILALNPYLVYLKDCIWADIPFLFFLLLALVLMERLIREDETALHAGRAAVLAGAMYLAYSTRSLGGLLVPSLLAAEFLRRRRFSATAVWAAAGCLALVALHAVFFHSDRDHIYMFAHYNLHTILAAIGENLYAFTRFWRNDYSERLLWITFSGITALASAGLVLRLKEESRPADMFFVLYLASMVLWPATQGERYFLPIFPLYLFYFLYALDRVPAYVSGRWGTALSTGLFTLMLCLIVIGYGFRFYRMDWGPIQEGPYTAESQALFRFIRDQTPKEAVFVFHKPRVLALYTDRKAAAPHMPADPQDLWGYIREIGAGYLVVDEHFGIDRAVYLKGFSETYTDRLRKVFHNPAFTVFEVIRPEGEREQLPLYTPEKL